jgi:hypothetical protein
VNNNDGVDYELGMRFKSSAAGKIAAIKFFKSSSESGTHVGKIYSSTGAMLASVTFSGETASGWQTMNLATPLAISAGVEYTVSVNTGNRYYVDTVSGMASQITNGPLSSIVGSNGVYGPVGSRPTSSWSDSNYFRDIVFVADTVAPTVSEIIMDNLVAGAQNSQITFTGQWCTSSVSGSYGNASLYSCGTAANTYTFKPNVVAAQQYDVYVRYSARASRSTAVAITVNSASGSVTKSFNETINGNTWVLHGRYSFAVGTSGSITTNHTNTSGDASVDGVKLVPVP